MPPHLHPRSRSTSLLFTTTLLAGFVVVGIPHVFPCPAPRKKLLDSTEQMVAGPDGQPIKVQRQRRRRRKEEPPAERLDAQDISTGSLLSGKHTGIEQPAGTQSLSVQREMLLEAQEEALELAKAARECPVPKPKGRIGQLLGFPRDDGTTSSESTKPNR